MTNQERIRASLAARHRAEWRFKFYGKLAIGFAILMLAYLMWSIFTPGIQGFMRHEVKLTITPTGDQYDVTADAVKALAPEAQTPADKRELTKLIGTFASFDVKEALANNEREVWVPMGDVADQLLKGKINRALPEYKRPVSNKQLIWLNHWQDKGLIRYSFNTNLFIAGDSRAPEGAGFLGSILGSLWLLIVCMVVALPIAILAAIYLQEFAPKNAFTTALEVSINNLAAVPSILYGLLGLSVFLQVFGMPRSSALVGGLTLAMLILPVMIIAARAAIAAVPSSMRDAAFGLGASPIQAVKHHVLPYALPGIMTGTILGVARAIGETAPLLMIGMVAFVADLPRHPLDPATAMPVQIYLWASSPELGFVEKTSAGIIILLAILMLLNALAITIRNRYELRWG